MGKRIFAIASVHTALQVDKEEVGRWGGRQMGIRTVYVASVHGTMATCVTTRYTTNGYFSVVSAYRDAFLTYPK